MNINFLRFSRSRPIYNSYIPPWAYPNGFVGLNVKLEHMTRVYYSELLAKNALKAEKIRISILIPLCYYRELHIQISERARALLDLKVGVRIGVTFPIVTLGTQRSSSSSKKYCFSLLKQHNMQHWKSRGRSPTWKSRTRRRTNDDDEDVFFLLIYCVNKQQQLFQATPTHSTAAYDLLLVLSPILLLLLLYTVVCKTSLKRTTHKS